MLIKTDPAILAGYLEDASGFTHGSADRLVIPESPEEIAAFLQAAAKKNDPVTISGGRTGVAAGCIPRNGTILSLEKLNHMESISHGPQGATITVEPGVRLDDLKSSIRESQLIYGPDPTERTGTLGGNVSTNASGGQCFKYGTTRQHILGLEAILSTGDRIHIERGDLFADDDLLRYPLKSGRILECLRPILPVLDVEKNAAGYFSKPGMDLLDLFIGAEGTLAVITKIKLRLLPAPHGIYTLMVFFPNVMAAVQFADQVRTSANQTSPVTGIAPASLEFMDENALNLIRPAFPNIPPTARAVLMMEQEFNQSDATTTLDPWAAFFSQHGIPDNMVWIAETESERVQMRKFRHALPETVNTIVRQRQFRKVGTDMAVPCHAFTSMLQYYYQTLQSSGLEYLIFGHIGECHLHVNVLPRSQNEFDQAKQLYMDFARRVVAHRGTVSAEHGIGKIKHDFLRQMVGEAGFLEMARIKRAFDPALILNRNNIFPEEYLE